VVAAVRLIADVFLQVRRWVNALMGCYLFKWLIDCTVGCEWFVFFFFTVHTWQHAIKFFCSFSLFHSIFVAIRSSVERTVAAAAVAVIYHSLCQSFL
jgi:hypothetical protein